MDIFYEGKIYLCEYVSTLERKFIYLFHMHVIAVDFFLSASVRLNLMDIFYEGKRYLCGYVILLKRIYIHVFQMHAIAVDLFYQQVLDWI